MTTNYSTFPKVSNFTPAIPAKALVLVDAEKSLIQLYWLETPNPEELTACASAIKEIIKENKITFFLHDIRKVNYTDINIQRCLAKVFCPVVLEAGVKRFVHLAHYTLPELLIMDEITTYIQNKIITNKAIKMETCTTPEGAFDWIQNSGISTGTASVKTAAKEVTVEQLSYEWAAAAQISSSLKQYKEKAAMVFRILAKRKSFLSEI